MDKVFVIIVTYNGIKWIDECLKSVLNSSIPLSVIVVDNKSTDGTVDYIKTNFSNEWLLQVYLYTLLTYKNYNILCKDIFIVNIYKGSIFKINFNELDDSKKVSININVNNSLTKILKLYNYNDDMINSLVNIEL